MRRTSVRIHHKKLKLYHTIGSPCLRQMHMVPSPPVGVRTAHNILSSAKPIQQENETKKFQKIHTIMCNANKICRANKICAAINFAWQIKFASEDIQQGYLFNVTKYRIKKRNKTATTLTSTQAKYWRKRETGSSKPRQRNLYNTRPNTKPFIEQVRMLHKVFNNQQELST